MWKDFNEKARQNAGFRAFQISEKIYARSDFNPCSLCGETTKRLCIKARASHISAAGSCKY